MKQTRLYPPLTLTKKQELRLKQGHPWVYAEEIVSDQENILNGSLVDVFSSKGSYLGTGIYSEHSKIRVRVLSNNANDTFDEAFFKRRVKYAWDYRQTVMPQETSYRIIHGEADGLPGVTVDRYNQILVAEILSFGMEQRKTWLYEALMELVPNCKGVYERNEGELRKKEGLPLYSDWAKGFEPKEEVPGEIEITENGLVYGVDFREGQKTGFFLDQKENRKAIQPLAKGRKVLDAFTHTGSFGMNAVLGGALQVTSVDVSKSALEMAKRNAKRNHLDDKMTFVEADVFDLLQEERAHPSGYDFIILDPPAFTKSRKTFANAMKGYTQINATAMKILPRGGYLATCSCSHFMDTDSFLVMLEKAAQEAGVSLRIIEIRHAAKDHPVLLEVPETDYLKFVLAQVI